ARYGPDDRSRARDRHAGPGALEREGQRHLVARLECARGLEEDAVCAEIDGPSGSVVDGNRGIDSIARETPALLERTISSRRERRSFPLAGIGSPAEDGTSPPGRSRGPSTGPRPPSLRL